MYSIVCVELMLREGHSDTLAKRLQCPCLPSAATVLRTQS